MTTSHFKNKEGNVTLKCIHILHALDSEQHLVDTLLNQQCYWIYTRVVTDNVWFLYQQQVLAACTSWNVSYCSILFADTQLLQVICDLWWISLAVTM
jgi:hypothetical protein